MKRTLGSPYKLRNPRCAACQTDIDGLVRTRKGKKGKILFFCSEKCSKDLYERNEKPRPKGSPRLAAATAHLEETLRRVRRKTE